DVEVVLEPSATITAENMSRSLPHLLARNVRETTIVCCVLHLPRVRYHFGGVYPRHGIRCSYALTAQLPTPPALAWEAAAVLVMRRQRQAALGALPSPSVRPCRSREYGAAEAGERASIEVKPAKTTAERASEPPARIASAWPPRISWAAAPTAFAPAAHAVEIESAGPLSPKQPASASAMA